MALRRTFGKNKGQIYKTTSGIRRRKVLAVHTVEVRVLDQALASGAWDAGVQDYYGGAASVAE